MDHSASSKQRFFSRLLLTVRRCHRATHGNSWADGGVTEISDPFSRLYYLRDGGAELHLRSGCTKVVPHGLYLIPAYTPCRYRCPVTMDLSCIHFSSIVAGLGPLHQFVEWPIEIHPTDLDWVEERIDMIVGESGLLSHLAIDGALRQLLGLFEQAAGDSSVLSSGATRFAPALRHIESNLGRVITVPELAAICHLQPNYFSDIFRKQFKEAPTRYIQRRKIERAAERLAISDVPLKELSDELGFTDAFHLSRTFKAHMGLPPSQYRQHLRQD